MFLHYKVRLLDSQILDLAKVKCKALSIAFLPVAGFKLLILRLWVEFSTIVPLPVANVGNFLAHF